MWNCNATTLLHLLQGLLVEFCHRTWMWKVKRLRELAGVVVAVVADEVASNAAQPLVLLVHSPPTPLVVALTASSASSLLRAPPSPLDFHHPTVAVVAIGCGGIESGSCSCSMMARMGVQKWRL